MSAIDTLMSSVHMTVPLKTEVATTCSTARAVIRGVRAVLVSLSCRYETGGYQATPGKAELVIAWFRRGGLPGSMTISGVRIYGAGRRGLENNPASRVGTRRHHQPAKAVKGECHLHEHLF